jgi:hypothetical protein
MGLLYFAEKGKYAKGAADFPFSLFVLSHRRYKLTFWQMFNVQLIQILCCVFRRDE